MIVYVIMTNDFPDRVMSDVTEAEMLCARENAKEKARSSVRDGAGPRVYWKVHAFAIDAEAAGNG